MFSGKGQRGAVAKRNALVRQCSAREAECSVLGAKCRGLGIGVGNVSANEGEIHPNDRKSLSIKSSVMVKQLMTERPLHKRNGFNTLSLTVSSDSLRKCEVFMHEQ